MFYLVDVIVERGVYSLNKPFTYAYLQDKQILKGCRVKVKFNSSLVVGFVVNDARKVDQDFNQYLTTLPYKLNCVEEIIDDTPILNEKLLNLANQVSSYYFAPLVEVLKVMLPPSLRPNTTSFNKPKINYSYYYKITSKEFDLNLDSNKRKIYSKIKDAGIIDKKDVSKSKSLQYLIDNEYITLVAKQEYRQVENDYQICQTVSLNNQQEQVYNQIENGIDKTYLLLGVTGSGKTEVYIKLVESCLNKDQGAIVLVPEISLTDRLISKFKSIFGEKVALFHSGLSDGEKYDEYLRLANNIAKIAIGTRSCIFAPVNNLKLIVIDEEQVESYKQDTKPFYDARKVALLRSKIEDCKVVYASATPLVETKAKADKGIFKLLRLDSRFNKNPLPEVKIVDLSNYENIDYNSNLISIPLRQEIQKTLDNSKQVILLLNRRGYSPIYICRQCQRIIKCPNCNIPLSYHKFEKTISCHHCDYQVNKDDLECPYCNSKDFTYTGFGTQRVEEEINKLFPKGRAVRLDLDTTRKKGAYHKILNDFNNKKYDIMIGTQMVAKGHDFPNVTLACCLLADQSLEIPSYKSNEDTFDLITQLVGRAGRKDSKGMAIIQTYSPKNDIINLASKQDYDAFYKYEMELRHNRAYPPYVYLIDVTISSSDRTNVEKAAYKVKGFLVSQTFNKNKRASIFGPSIPFIEKLNNRYYRKIMIKYKDRNLIQPIIEEMLNLNLDSSDVKIVVDVDPSSDI